MPRIRLRNSAARWEARGSLPRLYTAPLVIPERVSPMRPTVGIRLVPGVGWRVPVGEATGDSVGKGVSVILGATVGAGVRVGASVGTGDTTGVGVPVGVDVGVGVATVKKASRTSRLSWPPPSDEVTYRLAASASRDTTPAAE